MQKFLLDTLDLLKLDMVALISIKTLSTDLFDNFGVSSLSLLGPNIRHIFATSYIAEVEVLSSNLGIGLANLLNNNCSFLLFFICLLRVSLLCFALSIIEGNFFLFLTFSLLFWSWRLLHIWYYLLSRCFSLQDNSWLFWGWWYFCYSIRNGWCNRSCHQFCYFCFKYVANVF